MSDVRVIVASPATFKAFKHHYNPDLPIERLLYEQHQHRYEMFCGMLKWRSDNIYRDDRRRIECDAYDRENSIYGIAVDRGNNFLGSVRAYSTLHPYMLEEDDFAGTLHPGMTLPKNKAVFEGSRIISANSKIYSGYKPIKDIRIGTELLLSQLELGLAIGFQNIIGTMPPILLDKTYGRMGWQTTRIGPPSIIKDANGNILDEGVPTQNYICEVSKASEKQVRLATGLQNPICEFGVNDKILPSLIDHMRQAAYAPFRHRFPELIGNASLQTTLKLGL